MTCREMTDFLDDYIGGAMAADARAEFEGHLDLCPACVAYLETYRATIAMGRAAYCGEDDRIPEEVPEDLIRAILASRPVV